jgi:hypothetical protein
MWVGCQRHAPAALPPRKTCYPLYRRLGWPQSRPGQVRNTSPQRDSILGLSSESLYRLNYPGSTVSYSAHHIFCLHFVKPTTQTMSVVNFCTEFHLIITWLTLYGVLEAEGFELSACSFPSPTLRNCSRYW